ncbi:MAG: transposase, partial [Rhodopirellula sp. JB055]|uniref:transposase n=1 Tax=Rhodopirellula sp. JB055 TaxID=3342846 RepID=UPI00370ADAAA
EPVAYFITWTVYGTFLQGDARWWRKRDDGEQAPQPLLQQWHQERLNHAVVLLSHVHRQVVEREVDIHCERRSWKLWAVSARSNHVHLVVTAPGYAGDKVRDQLKANCTRGIREIDPQFIDRPVWTTKGDVEFVKKEDDLDKVIEYVVLAQDRMERGK